MGHLIPPEESQYIWLGPLVGNRRITNVALQSDFSNCSLADPNEVFCSTLIALKEAVGNNFIAAFTILGAGAMGMHYESVIAKYGMCPTPVAIGPKNTGKSTATKTLLNLLGTPQFFIRDFTAAAPSALNSKTTFPTVFDDPSDLAKVKALIDDSFNQGGQGTSKTTIMSRSLGIITINLDRLGKLCSNYK